SPADMQALENQIGTTLGAVRDKLREAAGALGRSRPDSMTEALNKARDLARGMESMDQRMGERATQGRQGQQGQQGNDPAKGTQASKGSQQGSQGQPGSQGEQGSRGQQGQGQQGQAQEGQQGGQG